MTDLKKLMELKIVKLKKNPHFVPRKSGLIKRISTSWRKPMGIHNKIRKCKRGKGALVRIGYSTPRLLKGLTRDLKKPVFVSTKKDLDNLSLDNVVVFPSSMGNKKKIELAKIAKSKNIDLFGFKNHDDVIKSIEDDMTARRKLRKNKKSRLKYKEVKEVKSDKKVNKKSDDKKTSDNKKSNDKKSDDLSKDDKRKEVEKILIQKGTN